MAQGGSDFGQHVVLLGRLWGRHVRVVSLRRAVIGTRLGQYRTPSSDVRSWNLLLGSDHDLRRSESRVYEWTRCADRLDLDASVRRW